MATNKNKPGFTANETSGGSWPGDGPKIIPLYVRDTSGAQQPTIPRGFGRKTATTNGGTDTGSEMSHAAVAETYDDGWDVGVVTVTTTAARVDNKRGGGAANSVITGRKSVFIRNKSTTLSIFYADDSSVTASSTNIGAELLPGAAIQLPFGENMTIYAITASSTADLEVFQFA